MDYAWDLDLFSDRNIDLAECQDGDSQLENEPLRDVMSEARGDVTGYVAKEIPEADVTSAQREPEGLPQDGKQLQFKCPPTKKGTVISVYDTCMIGKCDCRHTIGGMGCQLMPCRFAAIIFSKEDSVSDQDWELFEGVSDGFDIVDRPVPGYDCENYSSILVPEAARVMSDNVKVDLQEGRISETITKPTCIHSLGAVPKGGGRIPYHY